jgi:hypothetical protein
MKRHRFNQTDGIGQAALSIRPTHHFCERLHALLVAEFEPFHPFTPHTPRGMTLAKVTSLEL